MRITPVIAAFVLWLGLTPSLAADPVYPPGSRVGLAPLIGLSPSREFMGFETDDKGVKVLVAELPPEAYREVEGAFNAGNLSNPAVKTDSLETSLGKAFYTSENARDGNANVRRYSMIVPGGSFSGYVAVQVPENASKIYTDDAIRQMFGSVVLRKKVPVDEQLGQMPFKLTSLAEFKNVRTLAPGAAIVLTDSNEDQGLETAPFMVLGLIGNVPAQPDDRARFAQQSAMQIPGVREARITTAEAMRIDGTAGYETRIDGISGKDNTPVTIVQWLRFANVGSALRIIGSAPRDGWSEAFPRFRAVRDGIQGKDPK